MHESCGTNGTHGTHAIPMMILQHSSLLFSYGGPQTLCTACMGLLVHSLCSYFCTKFNHANFPSPLIAFNIIFS